uniref:Uncharacterized protein n=1 Tax=Bactrocera latifrons TaxID=174628 RepID=A0A0K8V1Z3_BACLA
MLRNKPKQHRTLTPKRVEHVVAASEANAAALLCESIQTSSPLSSIREPNIKEKLIQKHNKNIDTNFDAQQQQQKLKQHVKQSPKSVQNFNGVIKRSLLSKLTPLVGVTTSFFGGQSVLPASSCVSPLEEHFIGVTTLISAIR